jgi:hypothetical protein
MNARPGDGEASILASLVGRWHGRGTVSLPSMKPREYREEVRFTWRSLASLDYWQRAVDGSMLHSEAGIWRTPATDSIEISVALPGGTEVSEGHLGAGSINLESTSIGRAATGAADLGRTAIRAAAGRPVLRDRNRHLGLRPERASSRHAHPVA